MKQRDFSFLAEHFNFEAFELTPEHRFTPYILNEWKEMDNVKLMQERKMNYACVLKEVSTDEILYSMISPEPIDIAPTVKVYNIYLEQLPSLNLSDVAIFFAAIFNDKYFM